MAWQYSQSTAELRWNGITVTRSGLYSGHGAGRNNPGLQGSPNIGPIPQGRYAIGSPFHHPHAGDYTLRLTPQPETNTYGRSGFLIHGDSRTHPGNASSGCIIAQRLIRQRIWSSGDRILDVVP
ncbi:MAG: DUF2778 domain-containing protein [Telmatospirillum sp.]|nr:DUF2778 domain-containing protein [Telmatospirillum sp.]